MDSQLRGNNNIVFIANCFFSGLSGGDRHFIEIAKRWAGKMNIILMLPKESLPVYEKEDLKCTYSIIPSSKFISRLGIMAIYIFRSLASLFVAPRLGRNASIVYSTSQFLPDTLPSFFMKRSNSEILWISCIFHIIPHYSKRKGSFVRNLVAYYEQKLSFYLIKKSVNIIFVDNTILKEELIKLGFITEQIKVISMGVDCRFINSVSETNNKVYEAVFLGRLHPTKGVFDLPKIWGRVVAERPQAKLALIGSENDKIKKRLATEIIENKMENNIDILGFLETREVYKTLKSSCLFIFPSHEEGWGIAIAEAMACGLPVIAWNLPVYPEIFPKGMIMVEENNITGFSQAILRVLKDDGLCKHLGSLASDMITAYDWENVASNELKVISDHFSLLS